MSAPPPRQASLTLQRSEHLERTGGLRSPGVVGICVGLSDHALPVHDESRRNRKRPCRIAIGLGEVDAELRIHLPQILGQRIDETVLRGDGVATVAEQRERQRLLIVTLPGQLLHLRRDDDERGTSGRDIGKRLFQSCQLQIAVRSPATAEEAQPDGSALQEA